MALVYGTNSRENPLVICDYVNKVSRAADSRNSWRLSNWQWLCGSGSWRGQSVWDSARPVIRDSFRSSRPASLCLTNGRLATRGSLARSNARGNDSHMRSSWRRQLSDSIIVAVKISSAFINGTLSQNANCLSATPCHLNSFPHGRPLAEWQFVYKVVNVLQIGDIQIALILLCWLLRLRNSFSFPACEFVFVLRLFGSGIGFDSILQEARLITMATRNRSTLIIFSSTFYRVYALFCSWR